jgi:hypothetical protein
MLDELSDFLDIYDGVTKYHANVDRGRSSHAKTPFVELYWVGHSCLMSSFRHIFCCTSTLRYDVYCEFHGSCSVPASNFVSGVAGDHVIAREEKMKQTSAYR